MIDGCKFVNCFHLDHTVDKDPQNGVLNACVDRLDYILEKVVILESKIEGIESKLKNIAEDFHLRGKEKVNPCSKDLNREEKAKELAYALDISERLYQNRLKLARGKKPSQGI